MPTTRAVPVPYPTIQDAYDDADFGDTILLEPGTYPGLYMTKPVNIVGNTDDPCSSPVVLGVNPVNGYSILLSISSWGSVPSILFEAITPDYSGTNFGVVSSHNATNPIIVNRCNLTTLTGASRIVDGNSCDLSMKLISCTRTNVGRVRQLVNPTEIWVDKCEFLTAPYDEGWNVFVDDSVRSPTVGYGCAYGEFLRDQYGGAPFRIAGVADIDNASPDQVQVQLFIADTLGMKRTSWTVTTPDPTTGEWSFDYLPTDKTYYVALVPPEGYRPKLIGPYTPVQA